jgi:hypothetical protein
MANAECDRPSRSADRLAHGVVDRHPGRRPLADPTQDVDAVVDPEAHADRDDRQGVDVEADAARGHVPVHDDVRERERQHEEERRHERAVRERRDDEDHAERGRSHERVAAEDLVVDRRRDADEAAREEEVRAVERVLGDEALGGRDHGAHRRDGVVAHEDGHVSDLKSGVK